MQHFGQGKRSLHRMRAAGSNQRPQAPERAIAAPEPMVDERAKEVDIGPACSELHGLVHGEIGRRASTEPEGRARERKPRRSVARLGLRR